MGSQAHFSDLNYFYISPESKSSELVKRIQKIVPPQKIIALPDEMSQASNEFDQANYFNEFKGSLSKREFDKSKGEVLICEFKGSFFKRCPGSRPGLTCCNYFVLNLGQQCNMDCSYCYLQSFLNSSAMKIYSNIDRALAELRKIGETQSQNAIRVGTGEVIDSLSLDPLTHYSRKLITFFRDYPKWSLEFKSKSSYVDQFLDIEHAGNVIVSFSINPQFIISREEHKTASLEERLIAAEKSVGKGFKLAFHIDPMIHHEEWRQNYAEMMDMILNRFTPDMVSVVSVGALRFQPEQRHLMRDRFGMNSLVTAAEMFSGADGKLRYDQNMREEMFQFILRRFRAHSSDWRVFLCMETPETWLGAVGAMPNSVRGLKPLFEAKRI